jgi:hypothetical protein
VATNNTNSQTWYDKRTGNGGLSASTTAFFYGYYIDSDATTNRWDSLSRGLVYFDTSVLPDDAEISAASLNFHGYDKSDGFSTSLLSAVNIYGSTITTTTIANDHFQAAQSTAFSTSVTYADVSSTSWNVFSLNATGIAYIDVDGITYFTTREANFDVASTTPNYWQGDKTQLVAFDSNEGTASERPYLSVTYISSEPTTTPSNKSKTIIVD